MARIPTNRAPTHPGEMLREEFLVPYNITQKDLAARIGVSFVRVNEIVNGKRGVTPDTALRLEQLFGMCAGELHTLFLISSPTAANLRS